MDPMLSDEEVERVNRYLQVDAPPPGRADLAFVFGTRLPDPMPLAADLLLRDVVRFVILTGGPNRLTGIVEARAHRTLLHAAGVPDERIIAEEHSTNTLENVRFAIPAIDARIGLTELRSIVAITKWYHCRRALMTLRRHLPQGIRYYTACYERTGITRGGWQYHPEHARMVLGNMEAIPRYLARSHLAEVRRDGEAWI